LSFHLGPQESVLPHRGFIEREYRQRAQEFFQDDALLIVPWVFQKALPKFTVRHYAHARAGLDKAIEKLGPGARPTKKVDKHISIQLQIQSNSTSGLTGSFSRAS
jgi:hypothetical protein